MVDIRPIRIPGRWSDGRALDVHTVRSTHVGDDEFGHPRFETQRSAMGELLYRLKYKGDRSVVPAIAEAATAFVRSWQPSLEMVVTVPPSRERAVQPVLLVGAALAEGLGLAFEPQVVRRSREAPQLKDVFDYDERWRLLDGLHEIDTPRVEGRRVLLFDDLFRSGATLNAVTAALYDRGRAAVVCALTLTRSRSQQ
jgi:predicted amidophosphoribosyltransferase